MLTYFWAKRFELVPAVPNLRKKLTSKSWSGLRWQEETRQGKKRDKDAEADDKKVELVSYGHWGCPSLLTLRTNVKLLKLWKQVYWVSIHASVSVLKYQLTIDVLFFSSSCPTRPHHPVNLISFIGPSLKNVFFFQIKRFALLTMASSKYPSNVIRFDVGRHLKKSLLSYSTYHVNVFYTLETKKRYPLLLEFACLI